MKWKYVMILMILVGCGEDPISSTKTDNVNIIVDLLFTHDDCKVYRFYDGNSPKYFTKCSEVIWSESCGKNCVRRVSNKTN